MSDVVVVNGISQRDGRDVRAAWRDALHEGMAAAGYPDPESVSVGCTFYADLLGQHGPAPTAEGGAADLAHIGEGSVPQGTQRTPRVAQRVLSLIGRRSTFLSDVLVFGVAPRVLNPNLRQVRRYFSDRAARLAVRRRLAETITPRTSVLVGHSLGSVVAYEALCEHPEWPVRTLVTLGSPLGIPKLIFSRLEPQPGDGLGQWPGGLDRWVNVADAGDVTALVKRLASRFGPRVQDRMVDNGHLAHDLGRYLRTPVTGHAIASGLSRRLHTVLPQRAHDDGSVLVPA